MGWEIERKFEVLNADWRHLVTSEHRLLDAVVPFGDGKVRVRVADNRAWVTVKGPRQGFGRAEFEYEIPYVDGCRIVELAVQAHIVRKTRHCVPFDGLVWSVDVHESPRAGLVTAEVELDREDQVFRRPHWVGAEITKKTAQVLELA